MKKSKIKKADRQVFRQTLGLRGRFLQELRDINISYPWMKVALVVLLLILPFNEAGLAQEVQDVRPGSVMAKIDLVVPRQVKLSRLEGKKLVALTFDDGPSRETTGRLLDILKEKQVRVTFFAVGRMAEQSPELLKREKDEGHVVASHSMTHRNLGRSTEAEVQWEVDEVNRVFLSVIGEKPSLLRPPYGSINDATRRVAGQSLMLWSVDPEDWRDRNAEIVKQRAVGATFDGAVILMHDIYNSTVDAVPGVIDELRAQGYEFVTLPELAEIRGTKLEAGQAYRAF